MYRYGLVGLSVCLALTGCGVSGGTTINIGGSSGTTNWSERIDPGKPTPFDEGTVSYVGTTVVVWSDEMLREAGIGCHSRTDGVTVKGELRFREGKKWEVKGESADGKTGTITIADQSFNLADGNLFLVTGPGDRPRVKQLKRDMSGVDFLSWKSLQAFGAGDREITAFFSEK